jgi:hypothetical protein
MRPTLPEGHTVRFHHQRYHKNAYKIGSKAIVDPKGGSTLAVVRDAEGIIVAEAEARCSRKDNFTKRIGRDISLGRALKTLGAQT